MSTNVFQQEPPVNKPNRNSFDLSFANNLSCKIGQLVPVLCKEVVPGDTFNIDSSFGLKLMPMVFPVQTRMRARLHFFYVPNRILWKNWKKFYRGDKNVTFPYLAMTDFQKRTLFRNGSLGDYLGVPSSVVDSFDQSFVTTLPVRDGSDGNVKTNYLYFNNLIESSPKINAPLPVYVDGSKGLTMFGLMTDLLTLPLSSGNNQVVLRCRDDFTPNIDSIQLTVGIFSFDENLYNNYSPARALASYMPSGVPYSVSGSYSTKGLWNNYTDAFYYSHQLKGYSTTSIIFRYFPEQNAYIGDLPGSYLCTVNPSKYGSTYNEITSALSDYKLCFFWHRGDMKENVNVFGGISSIEVSGFTANSMVEADIPSDFKISALPFRAYEMIFNAIYRNVINDPFIKNGEPEYDDFLTNDGDGSDETPYQLFNEYWEKDFLTTALPSPQMGDAPLLGFSQNVRNSSSPDTSSLTYYELPVTVSEKDVNDGSDISATHNILVSVNKSTGAINFANSTRGNTELQGVLTALNDARSFGISINDLRNVNSLQRWLEKSIMHGYRYKDIINAHFGVELSLRELEMPEFLGGVTGEVQVSSVTQTTPTSDNPLGWQSGIGQVFENTKHRISRYCEEHGFIIGIMSVVCVPSYSQMFPKHFFKFGQLDYFDPDFAHIGMQPITMREVAPLQAILSNVSLEKVFGYQRAWYDYLSSTDEIHGEFRASLADFILTRVFAKEPELGHDFLTLKQEDLNNVFAVTAGNDHKIYGQVYFDIIAERPIPFYNEPKLE